MVIWQRYVWERRIVNQLSKDYRRSKNWIRDQLKKARVIKQEIKPQPLVIIIDATFFKRELGILVVRAPHLKRNLYWKEIIHETIEEYLRVRTYLENKGVKIKAVVMDGKQGARGVFGDVPIQMCHYHQKAIINRYLTTRPKLPAGIELRSLVMTLCKTNAQEFQRKLNIWHLKWSNFLKERTIDLINPKKWHYTHRKTRSAYRSLRTNLPHLFTYQRYPELKIPNTTNSLDGSFAHLKELIKLHRGLKGTIKRKMIEEILSK